MAPIKRDKIFLNNKLEYLFLSNDIRREMPLYSYVKFPALYVITYGKDGKFSSGFRMMHEKNYGYMNIEEYVKRKLDESNRDS